MNTVRTATSSISVQAPASRGSRRVLVFVVLACAALLRVAMDHRSCGALIGSAALLVVCLGAARPLAKQAPQSPQQPSPNPVTSNSPSTSLPPDHAMIVVTETQRRLRVVPLARGLSHPWGMGIDAVQGFDQMVGSSIVNS